jgi:hypothetical protein
MQKSQRDTEMDNKILPNLGSIDLYQVMSTLNGSDHVNVQLKRYNHRQSLASTLSKF